MSLEAILAQIEATTDTQIAALKRENEVKIQTILDKAKREAAKRYETARLAVMRPVAVDRAQRMYKARLAAERATAVTRTHLLQQVQTQAQDHLTHLRDDPAYYTVMRGLLVETAVASLVQKIISTLADTVWENGRYHQGMVDPITS